jgi:hypothetical protein
MDMIGHDNRNLQIVLCLVIVQTAIEDDVSNAFRQHRSTFGTEGNEMRLIVALQVRKLPSIKSLWHANSWKKE